MSRPTSRVLALLEILETGGSHTAGELAQRLGVDERTVRRYVEHLLELQIPVWSTRGREGGYRLAPGYRMPPLMLSDDEAVAVLLGLMAASRTSLGAATQAATSSAIAKVRRILPRPLADRVDTLVEAVVLTAGASAAPPDSAVLLALAAAVRERRPVSIDYVDRAGTATSRTIAPYGIVAHAGRWYVVAAQPDGSNERAFRLDRIITAAPQSGSFSRPEDLDLRERLLAALATAPYRHDVAVVVAGTVEELRPRLPQAVAVLEPVEEGVRIRIRADRLDWVPGLLLGLDRPFRVEGPEALRELIGVMAGRLERSLLGPGDSTRP